VEIARRVAGSSKLETGDWTEQWIESLARDWNGIVGQIVACTDDMAQARAAMGRSLAWQEHLFAAGEYEAAAEIVMAVHRILARWGERDRAKALLRGSIETLESGNKAVAQGNLATLLREEGKLAEALATYEAVYRTFEAAGARQNATSVLELQSTVLIDMGEYDKAIALQERSMELKQEIGFEEGQAISLHQLSILYMLKEDYSAAHARSQEAEKLARKLNNEQFLAAVLHQQGLIYTDLARAAATSDEATAHRAAALERFQASLAISRRIGDQATTGKALGELGKLWQDAGQMREAIAAFAEDLEIHQRLGQPDQVGIVLEFPGGVHERQDQLAAALKKYQQALELARKYGSPQMRATEERHISRVRGKMGQ
jgi:tetratricopeptide (TPR) repeat protein